MSYLLLIAGLLLLVKGADYLIDGSSSLARRLKVPSLIIGLTIVAVGTSLPEFIINVISAINGFAIAAGMEIVQATDIRIASKNAKFGLQEAKWGIFPLGGSTVRLPHQVPFSKAMEIMLTG